MGTCPFFFRGCKMLNRGLDKQELLRVVDSVANEKSIDKELILSSMETAIQKAAYSKFGSENEIEAQIDRKSGSIKIQKVLVIFIFHWRSFWGKSKIRSPNMNMLLSFQKLALTL